MGGRMKKFGIFATALTMVAIVSMATTPREELATRGLDFTPDVFVAQAGTGELGTVKLFLAAGMDVNARECCDDPLPNADKLGGGAHL